MKTNYFNSALIKPFITASKQNAAFVEGDVFFDWTGFEIPRGTAKLLGATIQIRPKNDSGQTVAASGIHLLIAKGPSPDATPTTIGIINSEINNFASPDVVAHLAVKAGDTFGTRTLYQSSISSCETVLEPNANSGSNVGVDKYYVAGIASGAIDITSAMTVDGTPGTNQAVLTIADVFGTIGMFAGDVIHDENDRKMGTAKLVDDSQITMEANLAEAGINDKKLYNVNPVRIILHFSK